jgi:hypothetical protein
MAEITGPGSYLDKLLFAQRVVKAAQFRFDQKQSIRELCEGVAELISALVDREQGREARADPPEQKPSPANAKPAGSS